MSTRREFLSIGAGAAVLAAASTRATESTASQKCPAYSAPIPHVDGKVAFVTGASSGIGLGIARAFADAGMKIAVGYRTKKNLDEALQFLPSDVDRILPVEVDVVDRTGMEMAAAEVVRRFGKVHVLVNNAGVVKHSAALETSYEDWDWQIGVNLNGVFNGVRAFLPRIQSHGEGGHIITTSSILGLFTGANSAAYAASKYAVVGLMESLRAEFESTNIGISILCPGLVQSNIADADRNRDGVQPSTSTHEEIVAKQNERARRHDPERAMDPLEVGRLVLRGMRRNDLYILTHPEYEQVMRDRNEALIASIPRDLQPTAARIEMARKLSATSIYAAELDRKRCAQGERRRAARS